MAAQEPFWNTITIRVPPDAEAVIDQALAVFYRGVRQPITKPVALGYMLELLAGDYLAGPTEPHPLLAACRALRAARKDADDQPHQAPTDR